VSEPSDEYRTGYGRPPREHQWKKGQSGNSRRRRPKRTESTVDLLDGFLTKPVQVTVNREARKVPALEAIIFQLLQKQMAGNAHASRTLLKYQEFASRNTKRRLEVTFVDNSYTRALADSSPAVSGGGHD
jgi:hypothetical protein